MADPGTGIDVRPPTSDDLPGIGELYRIVKGRPRPEQVTRHRFFDTPWGDSLSLIAMDGDRVVCIALVWPVALRVGNDVVLGGQGTDAVTHPDYRGRPRLFLSLARTIKGLLPERGIDVYYTFPNERSIKLTKLTGGTYLGTVGAWGLELPRRRISLSRRRRANEPRLEAGSSVELSTLIAAAHSDRNVIGIDKSLTWLTWRYSKASGERCQWLTLREDDRLVAAALVGERDPDLWGPDFAGLFRVHELFALGEAACESILRLAIADVSSRGARKLDILVKDPMLERGVERAGFVRESDRPMTSLVVRAGLALDALDFSHWRLISGDMDFF